LFAAAQDIFLSYNMFLLLNNIKKPLIIRDERRKITYAM